MFRRRRHRSIRHLLEDPDTESVSLRFFTGIFFALEVKTVDACKTAFCRSFAEYRFMRLRDPLASVPALHEFAACTVIVPQAVFRLRTALFFTASTDTLVDRIVAIISFITFSAENGAFFTFVFDCDITAFGVVFFA